jgi:uncharacterized protein (TIGR03546 family)
MIAVAVNVLRRFCRALVATNAPEQLAAGFTIGMVIGLVSKGNLIALSLCVLLFSIRCNKATGLLAALLFSFAGPLTDNFAHRVGSIVLGMKPLQATYAGIFNLPFGPWLGFNNTVIAGSLVMGIYLAYPVYWLTKQIFAAVLPFQRETAI